MKATVSRAPSAEALAAALAELAPHLEAMREAASLPSEPNPEALLAFAASMIAPLQRERDAGRTSNVWAIAGLKRNEVRVSSALADLWRKDFAGAVSTRFLAGYLDRAIGAVSWSDELGESYNIAVEECPIGEQEDRVDLVIRTRAHLVAIEVKIDAVFRPKQLERYLQSLKSCARHEGRTAHLATLSIIKPEAKGVSPTTWWDIARSAEDAAGLPVRDRTTPAQMIALFGRYVRNFT